jgi:two-component system, cell cycle sensor histidine kinase and response regulator CckA
MNIGPIRICCVEDKKEHFYLVKRALEKAPFERELTHFSSGEELLSRNISAEFDIILLDYKLPGKDGVEVIKEIRTNEIIIPIILLSAFGSEKVIAEALELGADDFMLKDPAGNYLKVISYMITKTIKKYKLQQENVKLQEEMLYSQKMQSISTLAQGIAHDFNNALVGIIGYSELLLMKLDKNDDKFNYVRRIDTSAKRMAAWVKQLLAYSKSSVHKLQPLDLNNLVHKCINIIYPSLEKRIQIFTSFERDLKKINADSNQIEQVVTNVLLNSVEAISGNGEIRIITENVQSIPDKLMYPDKKPFDSYAHLIIEDNGLGMDEETKNRVFEPFFSTKFIGRGLGMAAVYGIIEHHQGHISLQSVPNKGTKVEIFFPSTEQESVNHEEVKNENDKKKSILVVDDEPVTIEIVKKVFSDRGYNVLEARDGVSAIEIFSNHPNISLVLLDLIIPKKDGSEVFYELRKIKRDQKIIICTGYEKSSVQKLLEDGAIGLIQKPFSLHDIVEKVEYALGK